MTQPPQLDVVTLAVALLTLVFGHDAASVIGPYAVILLGALLGSAWATYRRPPSSRRSALGFMALLIGTTLLIAVPAALIVAAAFGVEYKWLLGPVAVVLAGIGNDWPAVGRWFVSFARDRLLGRGARRDEGGQP